MLEKNRFLAIKNLAKDIRKENEKLFKAFAKETMEDAIREKEEFIESVIDSMEVAFSDGEQGKEEKQIFRANVLIPDDLDFFAAYSKDKNIRNLMSKYVVSIEDVMSKITELNIYGKYIEMFNVEQPSEADFVDEMVNLSSKEAESLLDEIENLGSVMEELDIKADETENNEPPLTSEVIKEEIPNEEIPNDEILEPEEKVEPKKKEKLKESIEPEIESDIDDEFDDISNAVSGFVEEYNSIGSRLEVAKADLETATVQNESLRDQIESLRDENETLKKNNLDSVNALNEARESKNLLENENINLKQQIEIMDKKVKQSAAILKKIYNSIPRK